MKIEIDFPIEEDEVPSKLRGQINIKMHEQQEDRFKLLNLKHKRKLSKIMREFAYKLMDEFDDKAG